MSLSMYAISTPRFIHTLNSLAAILKKAEDHAETKKIDPAVLCSARLFPDMLPLTRQIQIACDNAKGPVARLANADIPKHEDTEATFTDLQARIAKTITFMQSLKPEQMTGSEDREIILKVGPQELKFSTGVEYLCGFALPNFYFHVVTAYDILRHNGVEIGKRDYLGMS